MGSVAQVSFGCGIGEMIGWSGGRWTIGGGTHGRIIPWDTFPTVRTGKPLNPKSPHSNTRPPPPPPALAVQETCRALTLSAVVCGRSTFGDESHEVPQMAAAVCVAPQDKHTSRGISHRITRTAPSIN